MNALLKIKDLLAEKGWSQNELAKRANLSQSTISSMFIKQNQPTIPTLECICRAFGITMADFFCDGLTPRTLTQDQMKMFEKWSACTPEQKDLLLKLISELK